MIASLFGDSRMKFLPLVTPIGKAALVPSARKSQIASICLAGSPSRTLGSVLMPPGQAVGMRVSGRKPAGSRRY